MLIVLTGAVATYKRTLANAIKLSLNNITIDGYTVDFLSTPWNVYDSEGTLVYGAETNAMWLNEDGSANEAGLAAFENAKIYERDVLSDASWLNHFEDTFVDLAHDLGVTSNKISVVDSNVEDRLIPSSYQDIIDNYTNRLTDTHVITGVFANWVLEDLKTEIAKVIVGQDEVVNQILISIFSGGHSLLIGVPGLAKTLMVNTIAQALGLDFKRIQFTPDLMPSDILGSEILDENRQFKFIKGPVFSNIILADEINRTPPKTQAALLEAMQERSVTVAGHHYKLDLPYFVLATQNPIEQEGTYPLPEAQLDRFMFAIKLDYPSFQEEVDVVKATTSNLKPVVNSLFSAQEIIDFQELIRRIPVVDNVIEYAVSLVGKTRPDNSLSNDYVKNYLDWGAGPRASQNLILAAKSHAAFNGKYSPDIEDVQAVAVGILRHRIIKNYKADAEGISEEMIINSLL